MRCPATEVAENPCRLRRRRNTCLQSSRRSLETQGFSGTLIQASATWSSCACEMGVRLVPRGDVTVLCPAQQVAFPAPGNGSVFHFRGLFTDRDGIDDLAAGLSTDRCMERAARAPLAPQVLHQLLFQHTPRLEEQASVNGLVGHAHALIVGILCFSHPEICSGDQSNTAYSRPCSATCGC